MQSNAPTTPTPEQKHIQYLDPYFRGLLQIPEPPAALFVVGESEAGRKEREAREAQEAREAALRAQARARPGYRLSGGYIYGYCTWGVAQLRPIPGNWGNAGTWFANARAQGFATSAAPSVGAIMVTRESRWGHVALVTAVHPDGSWHVKEMNYDAFAAYDERHITPGSVPLIGFIL